MVAATDDFATWIDQADIPQCRRTPQLDSLLHSVFRFRQQQGTDYYSTRLLSHFLLHCDCGLKVAQIARLLGIARPTASTQQHLSSKEAIHQAHHRMHGRPYGKLLPRYVGPIAAFLLGQPDSTRSALLDFVHRTFGVTVSRIALYKFLKKYGLNDLPDPGQPTAQTKAAVGPAAAPLESPSTSGRAATVAPIPVVGPTGLNAPGPVTAPAPVIELASALQPGRPSAPPFSSGGRTTPAPSC